MARLKTWSGVKLKSSWQFSTQEFISLLLRHVNDSTIAGMDMCTVICLDKNADI